MDDLALEGIHRLQLYLLAGALYLFSNLVSELGELGLLIATQVTFSPLIMQ